MDNPIQVSPPGAVRVSTHESGPGLTYPRPSRYQILVRHSRTRLPRVEVFADGVAIMLERFAPDTSPSIVAYCTDGGGGIQITWERGDEGVHEPRLSLVRHPDPDPDAPPMTVPWPVLVRGSDPDYAEPAGCLVVEIATRSGVSFQLWTRP